MAMALRNLMASPGIRVKSTAKPAGILPVINDGTPSSKISDNAETTLFPHDSLSFTEPNQYLQSPISHTSLVVDDVAISELTFLANHTDIPENTDLLSEKEILAFLDLAQETSTCLPDAHVSSELGKTCFDEKRKRSELSRSEKKNHVFIERARRKDMNDLLEKVRCLLPDLILKGQDKATLILSFIEHINAQRQKLEEMKKKRADLAERRKLSSDSKSDLSESINAADHDRSYNSNQNVCVAPSLLHVHVPFVRIHASGGNACNVSINCANNPRIFHEIVKTIKEHRLQLVNVHLASNDTMMSYNLHTEVQDGINFCKEDLQARLRKLIMISS